ncbi:hypothetical protein Tco_0979420, partial [Tanacetum coccineum]
MLFFLIVNLYVPFGILFDPKRYYKDGSHTKIAEAKILTHVNFSDMAPLPAADQRYPWLRYQVEGYTEDFEGLTPGMRQDLAVRLRMVYTGEVQQVFVSHAWRRLFGIRAPLVCEFILEFLRTCRMSDTEMGLDVADTLCFQLEGIRRRMIAYSISSRGQAPKKVTGVDLFYIRSMDRGTTNVLRLLAQYLFRHDEGRKSGARLSGGHFIGRLAMHFGLVSDEGLRGLQGPERQQATAAGAHEADEAGPTAEEGANNTAYPRDLAETMIWYILKRTRVELIQDAEALVNTHFAQEPILENYHEQNIREFSFSLGSVVFPPGVIVVNYCSVMKFTTGSVCGYTGSVKRYFEQLPVLSEPGKNSDRKGEKALASDLMQ